jgi:hypothetical protein
MTKVNEEILVIDLMLCKKCEKVSDADGIWRLFNPLKDKRDGYLIGLCPECNDV